MAMTPQQKRAANYAICGKGVRETSDGFVVVQKYDGSVVEGPFDTSGEAYAVLDGRPKAKKADAAEAESGTEARKPGRPRKE